MADVAGKAEDQEGSGEAVAQRQEPQSALPSPKPPAGSPLFVGPFPSVSLPLLLGTHRRREGGGQRWRESGREKMWEGSQRRRMQMVGQNWKGNWVTGQGQGRLEVQGNPGEGWNPSQLGS